MKNRFLILTVIVSLLLSMLNVTVYAGRVQIDEPNTITQYHTYSEYVWNNEQTVNIKYKYKDDDTEVVVINAAFATSMLSSQCIIPREIDGLPVTEIASEAFNKIYNRLPITSIIIPDTVTKIGRQAFEDCSGVYSVIIHKGIEKIGESAFERFERLKKR